MYIKPRASEDEIYKMLEAHKEAHSLKITLLEKLLAVSKTFTRKDISKHLKTHVEGALKDSGVVLSIQRDAYSGKYQINYWGDSKIGYGNRETFYSVVDPVDFTDQIEKRISSLRDTITSLTQDMQHLKSILKVYDAMLANMKDLDALSVAPYYLRDALPHFAA